MIKQSKIFKKIYSAYSVLVTIFCIYIFPPAHVLLIKRIAKGSGNIIIKLIPTSVKKYCAKNKGKIRIVEDIQDRPVYEPAYYPEEEGTVHTFGSPEIYIAELSDVTVHGGTGLIITGDLALTDVCENDTENRVKYASGPIRIGSRKALYVEASNEMEEIDTAISLCGLAASNYFHLTFEILSRFGYLKGTEYAENITVLLDEAAARYPQFVDLTHTVLGNASIKYIKEYDRIHCNKLIYPSMNTWMPMNVRKKNDFRISDNVLALSAAENIRKATEDLRSDKTDRKIFISRKNSFISRIINEKEIEELFIRSGYESVSVEDLSYREQVELFSSAACIVGATGAAFTNLVYCNPGTVFGCFFLKESHFCVYSTIAHMVGCKCLFFNGKVEDKGTSISNKQYRIDVDECSKYIDVLDKMIKA